MNKEKTMEFIRQMELTDGLIAILTEEKIEKFIEYEKEIFNKLDNLMEELFPLEIKKLCNEYIEIEHRKITHGNLWINVDKINNKYEVKVSLDPNKFDNIWHTKESRRFVAHPKNLEELKHFANRMKKFCLLIDILESEIENVYDKLSKWKTEYCNTQLEILNSITFPNLKPIKKYRVTVIIEEI